GARGRRAGWRGGGTGSSWFRRPVDDGDEVDVAGRRQARRHGRPADRLAGARHAAALDRVVGVARGAQVAEEAQQVLLVQQLQVDAHGAGVEVDVGRLAGRGIDQLLALDAIAHVEQFARDADAVDRVGPFQAALFAEDVEGLEALVDVDLLADLAL